MTPHQQFLAVTELMERVRKVRNRWEPIFGNDNNDAGQLVNTRIAEMVLEHYRPKRKKIKK